MFIVDFFRTMKAVRQAKSFIKEHDEVVNKIKGLIVKIKDTIAFYEKHKSDVQVKIDDAKSVIEKLKGFLK